MEDLANLTGIYILFVSCENVEAEICPKNDENEWDELRISSGSAKF